MEAPHEIEEIGAYNRSITSMNTSRLTDWIPAVISMRLRRVEQVTFALFMGSLIVLLILLYADVLLV
jgi:hypothetical protein